MATVVLAPAPTPTPALNVFTSSDDAAITQATKAPTITPQPPQSQSPNPYCKYPPKTSHDPSDCLPHFTKSVHRSQKGYKRHCYQYGMTSFPKYCKPLAVVYPTGDAEVMAALNWAHAHKVAVALRTGGHQYSAASSTTGDSIQIDLSETYTDKLEPRTDIGDGVYRHGISFTLAVFLEELKAAGMFLPTGQCSNVHLGGHVQTGGYGQFARSFGLLADHIEGFDVIMAPSADVNSAVVPPHRRTVLKRSESQEDRDIMFALLGGSPGNIAVVTHVYLKPLRDADHPDSRGFKRLVLFSCRLMRNLMNLLVAFSEDEDMDGDFDFCLTVVSLGSARYSFSKYDNKMLRKHPAIYGTNATSFWPPAIAIYAQWANVDGTRRPYDDRARSYFDRIDAATKYSLTLFNEYDHNSHTPLSELALAWMYGNVREFTSPYLRRTYSTNSTQLSKNNYAEWLTKRVKTLMLSVGNGCHINLQAQFFGGAKSAFRSLNDPAGQALSWRADTRLGVCVDVFYHDKPLLTPKKWPKRWAEKWQKENDRASFGLDGNFALTERRVLWGSWGDHNLHDVRAKYFESEAKYQRLVAIKRRVDPFDVLTPNKFCVGVLSSKDAPLITAHAQTKKSFFKSLFHLGGHDSTPAPTSTATAIASTTAPTSPSVATATTKGDFSYLQSAPAIQAPEPVWGYNPEGTVDGGGPGAYQEAGVVGMEGGRGGEGEAAEDGDEEEVDDKEMCQWLMRERHGELEAHGFEAAKAAAREQDRAEEPTRQA